MNKIPIKFSKSYSNINPKKEVNDAEELFYQYIRPYLGAKIKREYIKVKNRFRNRDAAIEGLRKLSEYFDIIDVNRTDVLDELIEKFISASNIDFNPNDGEWFEILYSGMRMDIEIYLEQISKKLGIKPELFEIAANYMEDNPEFNIPQTY